MDGSTSPGRCHVQVQTAATGAQGWLQYRAISVIIDKGSLFGYIELTGKQDCWKSSINRTFSDRYNVQVQNGEKVYNLK